MDNLELKKYCVEKAIGSADIVKVARELYEFLVDGNTSVRSAPIIRKFILGKLSNTQKAVLSAAIDLHHAGEPINGESLGKKLKCTGANACQHLKKLKVSGYVRRDGNKWWPVYDSAGNELPPVIIKCPPGVARGFKPLTAPLGKVGRIK